MPFRIGLVIWPDDIHTPDIHPNTFMGGVVLGHDAWAIAGNKKEGSALDSPFVGKIGCSGWLNLQLFAHAYTFSIALTVAGSAFLNCQSYQQMESHVKLSSLLSFGKVTCTMHMLPVHGCKDDGVVGTPRNHITFDGGKPYNAFRASIPAGCKFLTQHVSRIDLRLNLLSPVVEEFCNLVQCCLNQRRDWKTEDPLQDSVHVFGENTLCPNGGCQPVLGLSRVASNLVPRSEIKNTSRSFAMCSRSLHKNHDHADSVSPSTSANATGTMFLFPSCPIAISSECLYLPYRNVSSTCSIGFSCHHPSIQGLNAQNKRLNWTTLSSPSMSTVWNDTTIPDMACCTAAIQPGSLLYESTQLPYTRAMAFCFPRHAFLYETVKPLAFFTVSTTKEMGMSAFSVTKPAINSVIMSESSFGWSFAITVDAQLWGPSYMEIIHS
ncbi:protein MAIN-LIKE 2-like [Senna tora]|uniref:Protein MAIN-LIKE 2-like n=1 Tax=Senna tora TaxID=362788 RepID=A0A834WVX7_9FABA|nr:protein MAIN-LIKE 2-like [Senna tora]